MTQPSLLSQAEPGLQTTVAKQAAAQTHGVYVCVHGHFYQPPREHPSLDVIPQQPSAAPFHDWNERIFHESYRPNAFARVLGSDGRVARIVNNYEYINFNIGPTLMSWLERYDLETYQRIIQADRVSCDRNQGHGNAIAQVYNHIIMPLANRRDKVTQIRWGIADFQRRFGRAPEGMWLAETAVDQETLEVLVSEDIQFIILAPSQAAKCRRFGLAHGFEQWHDVEDGSIDPTQPYRCFIPQQSNGRHYIDIFFYDGPISGDMGFDNTLMSAQSFANRLDQAVRDLTPSDEPAKPGEYELTSPDDIERFTRHSQLISVATDGETFGHHRSGAEKTLAYTLLNEFPSRGWQVTNYANYLSQCPPTWEVQLKPVTAWSCSHGVDRWQADCGCGGGGGWQQAWRAPLREGLDTLRDRLIPLFEKVASPLLSDPWAARNDYIHLISDRTPSRIEQFFVEHQARELSEEERAIALRLLEMQRHTLLMYTSCGWFFDEISRPEGTQILRYAGRAIELAESIPNPPEATDQLESDFIEQLSAAPSNVDYFKTGAGVYLNQVKSQRVSLEHIVAHYAMGTLFNAGREEDSRYGYRLNRQDFYQQPLGSQNLVVGCVQVTAEITQETTLLAFAVLHFGGWDFQCGVQTIHQWPQYTQSKSAVVEAFNRNSIAQSVLAINQQFSHTYTLQDLFQEERQQLMQQLNTDTLDRLNRLYEQVYRENYGVLMAYHRDRIAVPQALQVAADLTLSDRATQVIRTLEQDIAHPDCDLLKVTEGHIAELEGIAIEANHLHANLKLPEAQTVLVRLVKQAVNQTLQIDSQRDLAALKTAVEGIQRLVALGNKLGTSLGLYKVQEQFYRYLTSVDSPESVEVRLPYAKLAKALTLDIDAIWPVTTSKET